MSDVDEQIMWLASLVCMPTRRGAVRAVFDKMKGIAGFCATDMPKQPGAKFRGFSEWATCNDNPVLAVAFDMIAMTTKDPAVSVPIIDGATGLLCSANGDTSEARARLRVWRDVSRGKHTGNDFFEIAETHWCDEMQHIVAKGEPMRDRFSHAALQILMIARWDDAFGSLQPPTRDVVGDESIARLIDAVMLDRTSAQVEIRSLVDELYANGTPASGALALAWSMLTADPCKPESFTFLPQLQDAIDRADLEADDDADVRARMRIWWRAASCEWPDSEVSLFRIADVETRRDPYIDDHDIEPRPPLTRDEPAPSIDADPLMSGPTLVVMPATKATKLNNFHTQYKDIVDAALPLVVVRDIASIRAAMHAEFPHAVTAVDLLLRDLREAKPFFIKPICLVGTPGSGKSRLVRRLADLVRYLHVQRFDAASSTDSAGFAGSSKAWSNTEPSVPFRAIAQSGTANPVVMIDEVDKASGHRSGNGRIADSMLAYLDRETSSRQRDQSLDAELNMSMVTYIATANDVSAMPAPLRDRFRIVKVPTPTLAHLPALAASVMRDLAAEDESRQADAPLAGDELAVIAKAWSLAGFSMRALQKIVAATLDVRDSCAMRH